jgi:hypothetical protein
MKYGPADLERMRHSIAEALRATRSQYELREMERSVETHLLTYMANETTPEELEVYAKQAWADYWERTRKQQEAVAARSARSSKAFAAIEHGGKKRWWHL